jgi:hypothetical protein
LLFAICLRKKERRGRAGRSNHDPPLGSAVVCQDGRVFQQLEAEALHEELDGLVVVIDDHSDLLEVLSRRQSSHEDGKREVRCCIVAAAATGRPSAAPLLHDPEGPVGERPRPTANATSCSWIRKRRGLRPGLLKSA